MATWENPAVYVSSNVIPLSLWLYQAEFLGESVEHLGALLPGQQVLPHEVGLAIGGGSRAGKNAVLHRKLPGLLAPLAAVVVPQAFPVLRHSRVKHLVEFLLVHIIVLLVFAVIVCPGVHYPVVGTLVPESGRVSVHPPVLGTGGVVDPDFAVCPPDQNEVASACPVALFHECDKVVPLPEVVQRLVVDGGPGLVVGVGPAQLPALDAEGRQLRGKVAVVGPLPLGLVPVGHGPGAGVYWGVGLAGQGLDDHGSAGGATAGAADGGPLSGDLV